MNWGAFISMPITLRHIEIFHAVMVAGSVTRAAEALRTSQPTVSRELHNLELSLGFALFERRSKRLFATEQAFRFHAEVQRSFTGLQHLLRVADDIRDKADTQIEVACLPLLAQTLMPGVCKSLLEERPAARISFHPLDQSVLLGELLGGRYEVGLVETGVAIEGAHVRAIEIGNEVCILPEGHPLASKSTIKPEDLCGHRLVGFGPDDWYNRRFDRIFAECGLQGAIQIETTTAEAVCTLVRYGIGIALINPITARAYYGKGIQVRRLSVPIPFVLGICRPFSRPPTKLGEKLVQHVLTACLSIKAEMETWEGNL